MRRTRFLFAGGLAVLPAVFALLAGCYQPYGTTPDTGKPVGGITRSGFLGDYSGLAPDDEHKGMIVYRKSPDVLKSYDKFIVDPFLLYFHRHAQVEDADEAELQELADYFRNAVITQLEKGGAYQVVRQPGPGVARVRVAITDIRPGKGKGGASFEAEILDSASGERLAAAIDSRRGSRLVNVEGKQKWAGAAGEFERWAEQFRERLDKIHGSG